MDNSQRRPDTPAAVARTLTGAVPIPTRSGSVGQAQQYRDREVAYEGALGSLRPESLYHPERVSSEHGRPTMSYADGPLGYFITFRCYGTWLHGDARGSMDLEHRAYGSPTLPPNPIREHWEKSRLRHPPTSLDDRSRDVVAQTIREVCESRNWQLRALSVRGNHVHVVVTADGKPETVMGTLKAWCSRRLRDAGMHRSGSQMWSRHGSTVYLWHEKQVESACEYVINGQGDPLPSCQ